MTNRSKSNNTNPTQANIRPRGFKLTALIYEELARYAGEEFSATELMQAAQRLVKISRDEYIAGVPKEYLGRPQYYALNLCTAFEYYPWHIVSFETYRMRHCDHSDYSLDTLERFRTANLCLNDMMWEF